MNDIRMHICPNCGGDLHVDIEHQMYECPFCGRTFDYDYFREESVLDIAARALEDHEFTSAGMAYDFMLEKEPDNFEALRGKALIAMGITGIDDLRSLDLYPKLDHASVSREIDTAIGSSKPQDREYFTVMKDIVDAGHEYTDEKASLETRRSERKKYLNILNGLVEERDGIYIYSSSRIRTKKAVFLTILCYLFCCLMIFLGYKYTTRNPYSKAEDLSKYEKALTEDPEEETDHIYVTGYSHFDLTGFDDWYSNYQAYQEALEREEKRKINYDTWEKTHPPTYTNLIWILGFFTATYAVIVFMIFRGGRILDNEIAAIRAQTDEKADRIRDSEERMTELKDRIDRGYERLCELKS